VLNFRRNYVRLNEFPEWFTVEPDTLYTLTQATGEPLVRLGSEMVEGIELAAGNWVVERYRRNGGGPLE
jgi:hypothetical protein